MNESPAFLSDDALAQLICEAKATVQSLPLATHDVFERVRRFNQFYSGLAIKPEGAALLYQDSMSGEMRCHTISHNLTVGRLAKSDRHPTGCDLALEDDELSRRHFEIGLIDGLYVLRDLESRNGIALNDHATKIKETLLKAGDVIFAGRGIFVFTGD